MFPCHSPRSNIVPVYTFNIRIARLQLSSRASKSLLPHSILLARIVFLSAGEPKIADDWSLISIPHSDYITLLQQRSQRYRTCIGWRTWQKKPLQPEHHCSPIRRSTLLKDDKKMKAPTPSAVLQYLGCFALNNVIVRASYLSVGVYVQLRGMQEAVRRESPTLRDFIQRMLEKRE
jgi:hypothetical protein